MVLYICMKLPNKMIKIILLFYQKNKHRHRFHELPYHTGFLNKMFLPKT